MHDRHDSLPSPLPRRFFARDAATVARDLVGALIVRDRQLARIVETEAYVGAHDLACHASKGRTKRTDVMFGPPGRAYVYLIYGMYDMLNVVTGQEGQPEAVLIRAAEAIRPADLALDGPGKLTRELGITRAHNRIDLCRPGDLYLASGQPAERLAKTARINVDYAGPEWSQAPLRFYDPASPAVSRR